VNHSAPKETFRIIDALGPFCINLPTSGTVNWSKVPFASLEKNGRLPAATALQIIKRFERYALEVHSLGYDSLSVDDLAHMVSFPFYTSHLQALIQDYQRLYRKLFTIAKKYNMRVVVNSDYLFYNSEITAHLKTTGTSVSDFFVEILETAFRLFPEIDGTILRIGEHDGKDVKGTFLSRLTLRTPKQANALLQKVLPVFEAHNKRLIFRTWTVGVYSIGDLIWNKRTFNTVFSSISSEALIISMKFGDTDFMRFLSLNPLFFHDSHKKIIELQTRREWEGMGMYPSFVGWQYAQYFDQLKNLKPLVGIHVWCQTGGWAKASWNSLTYIENSSFWNELNTEVTLALYEGVDIISAITSFCKTRGIGNIGEFIHFLELSEIAIKNGLYVPQFAARSFYLRRTRLPTLLWIRWDTVMLQPTTISFFRMLVARPYTTSKDSQRAIKAVAEMQTIAQTLALSKEIQASLAFQYATFSLFAKLRLYMFGNMSKAEVVTLNEEIKRYSTAYPQHYTVPHLKRRRQSIIPKQSTRIFLRTTNPYRKRDRVMLSTSPLQRLVVRYYLRLSRSDLLDQSMGIDVLFK